MVFKLPDKFFLVQGCAEGPSFLNSFDNALLDAGIGNTNLIRVSSIIPPGATEIPAAVLPFGSLVPIAYSYESSDVAGETISAAVAVGLPKDASEPGVVMENHLKGPAKDCEETVRRMVMYAFEKRGCALKDIRSVVATVKVIKTATAFAGVVMWT
jgi:arginine decarboxylase